MDEGVLLLAVGAILCASVVGALAANRTGVPVLVAFLVLGMILGSDGPGGIEFDDAELAREVGIVGLVLILFEGGLQTSWRRLRSVVVPAALLSTVGVVVTAVLTGAAAHVLFDLSWLEAVLLGAVVASTDAAAVFATLRFTHIRRRVARTLEAESGGNDPTAIALTLGLIAWIESPEANGMQELVVLVVRQLGLGLVVGVVLGLAATWIFARLPDTIGPFAPAASLAAAGVSFGVADVMGGSGFLAVYLVGLAVGSTPSRYRRQLVGFHEGLAFVAQVTLFIVFGLLVFPSDLPEVALSGLALAFLLVVLVRPAAVWASKPWGNSSASSATWGSSSPARSSSSHAGSGLSPAMDSGSVTFSATVRSGSRWKNWKMKPMRWRRIAARCSSSPDPRSVPSTNTWPADGLSRPASRCSSVDLPEPDLPMIATRSRGRTAKSTPRSTSTGAGPW